jgi:apolipoprotein D and lipocalin family protein
VSEKPEVRSVDDLDLQRYLGLWYEVGRLPMRFEDDSASDVTAEYSLNDDGTVKVDNRCLDEEGKPTQALGEAVPDPEHPGRLRVSFLPEGLRWIPFTRADYWVLKIDGHYRHALVGTPDHKYLWLLAREPHIDPAIENEYLAEAERQGYELAHWIRTPQSGERVTDGRV